MSNNLIKKILLGKKKEIMKCNILCIGDIILDHYVYGRIERMSPEAPIPVLSFDNESYRLGGAGNVARNLSSLGVKCDLIHFAGKDLTSKIIKQLISKENRIKQIKINLINYKVPIKKRYINKGSHLIRVDKENKNIKLSKNFKKKILEVVKKHIKKNDIVILSDYNKGFFDKSLIQEIVKIASKHKKSIIADPKKNDLSNYSGINLITPNQKEIEDAAGKHLKRKNDILKFCRKIMVKYNIDEILLTRSEKGMILIGSNYSKNLKAYSRKVVDVTGAGDTVIAILALMKALGINTQVSADISNYAAGLTVVKEGTSTNTYDELISEK
tara:strand:- start:3516 stop:4499 length:984 start_codon:yes stop_codon:yes gene_type:complete